MVSDLSVMLTWLGKWTGLSLLMVVSYSLKKFVLMGL